MTYVLFKSPYSKNFVLKNKAPFLKQSTSVKTEHKTEHKRPISLQYFLKFVMLQRLDKLILLPKFKSCVTSVRPNVLGRFGEPKCKRFKVQTLLRSLEIVTIKTFEHNTIVV